MDGFPHLKLPATWIELCLVQMAICHLSGSTDWPSRVIVKPFTLFSPPHTRWFIVITPNVHLADGWTSTLGLWHELVCECVCICQGCSQILLAVIILIIVMVIIVIIICSFQWPVFTSFSLTNHVFVTLQMLFPVNHIILLYSELFNVSYGSLLSTLMKIRRLQISLFFWQVAFCENIRIVQLHLCSVKL